MIKILTKGEIRESALTELRYRGITCWKQNNLAVRGRKFIGMRGVCDIIGYNNSTGVMVGCEIKTVNDRLSDDQKVFLTCLKNAGGIALIAKQSKTGQVVLENWDNNAG
jgi:hypothetical protein